MSNIFIKALEKSTDLWYNYYIFFERRGLFMSINDFFEIGFIGKLINENSATLSGGALGDSNLKKAIVFFIISAVTGILGFIIYKLLFSKKKDASKNSICQK